MVDLVTVTAAALVAVASGSYLYEWPTADMDARVGDGLFLVGVATLLFADDLLAGVAVDAALVAGAGLAVAGFGVKLVGPFSPDRE